VWQTPGDGEAFMDGMVAMDAEDRAALFTAEGASADDARALATAFDRTMADAILALYRSATKVHEAWGPAFVDVPQPGLVIVPTNDVYLDGAQAQRAAERVGARVATLEGVGHWWMLSQPEPSARLLEDFWASVA
jgi:pimeloyl-ACP methyl ester carboxylesterase